MKMIEQKGIVFLTTTLVIHSPFCFPSLLRGMRKGEIYNQSRGKKNNSFLLDQRILINNASEDRYLLCIG